MSCFRIRLSLTTTTGRLQRHCKEEDSSNTTNDQCIRSEGGSVAVDVVRLCRAVVIGLGTQQAGVWYSANATVRLQVGYTCKQDGCALIKRAYCRKTSRTLDDSGNGRFQCRRSSVDTKNARVLLSATMARSFTSRQTAVNGRMRD